MRDKFYRSSKDPAKNNLLACIRFLDSVSHPIFQSHEENIHVSCVPSHGMKYMDASNTQCSYTSSYQGECVSYIAMPGECPKPR